MRLPFPSLPRPGAHAQHLLHPPALLAESIVRARTPKAREFFAGSAVFSTTGQGCHSGKAPSQPSFRRAGPDDQYGLHFFSIHGSIWVSVPREFLGAALMSGQAENIGFEVRLEQAPHLGLSGKEIVVGLPAKFLMSAADTVAHIMLQR